MLALPIVFEKNIESKLTSFIYFGILGNGKSTHSSTMSRLVAKRQGIKFLKEWENEAGESVKGVTTENKTNHIGNVKLTDTPGHGDSDETRNEALLFQKQVDYLNSEEIQEEGVAAFLMMIQVSASCRTEDSHVQLLLKMLQTLTLTFPGSLVEKAPKIIVVFSNFSQFKRREHCSSKNMDDDGSEDEDLEDLEEEVEEERKTVEF